MYTRNKYRCIVEMSSTFICAAEKSVQTREVELEDIQFFQELSYSLFSMLGFDGVASGSLNRFDYRTKKSYNTNSD